MEATMLQAVCYLIAVILIFIAAFGVSAGRVSLALLGAGFFVLGYTLPAITAAI